MGLDYDADTKSLLLSPDGGKAWFTYEAGTKWKCYDYGARRMSDREFVGPPECV
jgi:hypothetical protein